MAFFEEISINSYRGIHNLTIRELDRINLIVGDNNCGKTSVLEAVQLLRTSGGLADIYKISRQREALKMMAPSSIYESIFFMFSRDESELLIDISGRYDSKIIHYKVEASKERELIDSGESNIRVFRRNKDISFDIETDVLKGMIKRKFGEENSADDFKIHRFSTITGMTVSRRDEISILYVAPFEHLKGYLLSNILMNDDYKDICLNALQLFDSDIVDMLILRREADNRPVEYIKHSRLGNMPISTFGDGIKKVLVLANAIARVSGGILLIDEIETAIHKKYYEDIFSFIVKACAAFDVQVFITTHSIEAIDGLLATQQYEIQDNKDDIRVLTGREVFEDRESFGFEVRL